MAKLDVHIAATVALLLCGCGGFRLHNPEREALAEKAEEQLNTLIAANQGVFETMHANLEAASAHEVTAHSQMSERLTETVARVVLKKTWDEVRADYSDTGLKAELSSEVARVTSSINEDLVSVQLRRQESVQALDKATEELKSAQSRVTAWNRRLAVLDKLVELMPETAAFAEAHSVKSFQDIGKDLADRFKDEEITFFDAAEGKEKSAPLSRELPKVLDTDQALRNGDSKTGKVIAGLRQVVNPEAPGLALTIAHLAKDLAERERSAARSHAASLAKRVEIRDRMTALVERSSKLIDEAGSLITDFSGEERVEKTLADLVGAEPAADANAQEFEQDTRGRLAGALLAIDHYVTIAGPLRAQLMADAREDAYLRHKYSIEVSRLNSTLHEALASRGIEGLVTFHRGGAKAEDIAEIVYRAAQLTALGVIASKTD